MDIIQSLNSIDTDIFLFLNGIHSSYFDTFMYTFSGKWIWVPFYAALLYVIIRTWKKDSIWIILAMIACIVLADQISSGIIKNLVERPRPSRAEKLEGLVHIVNGYRGGRFGFVSSHAANTFGLAMFCTLLFRRKVTSWIIFLWAVVTAYSRIYLGVHYPFDIVGGALVGTLAALLCYAVLKHFRPQIWSGELGVENVNTATFSYQINTYLYLWVLLVTVLGIALYSAF